MDFSIPQTLLKVKLMFLISHVVLIRPNSSPQMLLLKFLSQTESPREKKNEI